MVICVLSVCLLATGCLKRPNKGKRGAEFSQFSGNAIKTVRRVVIMPIYRDSRISEKAMVFQEKLIRSLAELNHFEVLIATEAERSELFPAPPYAPIASAKPACAKPAISMGRMR